MTYRTIVVHLDCGNRSHERLALAVRMAAQFHARLIGLFALDLYAGMPATADAGSILVEAELQRRERCMDEAHAAFRETCAAHGIAPRWQSSEDDAATEVLRAAQDADLVVIGQTNPATRAEDGVRATFDTQVVLTSGKPVLIVPYAGHFEGIGRRTLVAWNAAPEAARALAHALPVLEHSQAVRVVSFDEGVNHRDPDEAARIAVHAYLLERGVNATVTRYFAEEASPGERILARAHDEHADCIVMGAYGNSRDRQTLLGGATRTIMNSMTVPVIMSN